MGILTTLILTLLGSWFFVPTIWLNLGTHLPDHNDSLLITYILNQIQINLTQGRPLFWGSFFAPYSNTLTFSEPFITSALISLPLHFLKVPPLVIFNFNLLLGFGLTAVTLFLLLRTLTSSAKTACWASLFFVFSSFHLTYLAHLQMFNLWLVPLALWSFIRLQQTRRLKFFHLFCLLLTLQLFDSVLLAFFIIFAAIAWYIHSPFPLKKSYWFGLMPYLLIGFLVLNPYFQLSQTFPEAVRPIRDAAHFSLGPEEWLTSFPSLLFFLVLVSAIFRSRVPQSTIWKRLGLFAFILTLGPVLKFNHQTVKFFHLPIPLPYTLFYYFFPGFQAMRTPSRWIVLGALSLTVYIALKCKKQIEDLSLLKYSGLLLTTLLFSWWPGPRPSFFIDTTLPTPYNQVRFLPDQSILLELPIKLWNMPGSEIESLRSLYSLDHQRRRLNGYSGFAPEAWIDLVNQLNSEGLTTQNLQTLKAWGITHVILNQKLIPLQLY